MTITAKVAVALLRAGERVQIAAGDPLPELSADEARDLLDAGALNIDTLKAGFASQSDATRAGAGFPGTNTTRPGPAVASVEGGVDSTPPGDVVTGDGTGESLPEIAAEHYAPGASALDTSPARPDESVPELVREQPAPAARKRTKAQGDQE